MCIYICYIFFLSLRGFKHLSQAVLYFLKNVLHFVLKMPAWFDLFLMTCCQSYELNFMNSVL